jgi:lysophospholipase L1-like esterase
MNRMLYLMAISGMLFMTTPMDTNASDADKTGGATEHAQIGKTESKCSDNPLLEKLGLPKSAGGFTRKGYHLWDPSIVKVGDTWHMFASCWPRDSEPTEDQPNPFDSFLNWKQSYVIRAVSKDLLGPYEYVEDVIHPRPGKFFDSSGCHNPKITFHKGTYYLYYLGIPAWKSGVAVSDSVEGPWKRQDDWCTPANNPALWIHEEGSVYGVGKVKVPNPKYPGSRKFNELFHYIQAFRADSIFGPYTKLHEPKANALPENYENEDPCLWYDGEHYHMIITDLHGFATGLDKAFTYYTSKDGLKFKLVSKEPLMAPARPIRFDDGSEVKFQRVERPNIVLNEEGDVIALLAACLPQQESFDSGGAQILVFPVSTFSLSAQAGEKTTILAFGDSITQRSDSYRSVLVPALARVRPTVTFIGPEKDSISCHAGYGGKNTKYLLSIAKEVYSKFPADIVMIHSGHNSFAKDKPVKTIIRDTHAIIDTMRGINPDVTILLAQVILAGKLPKYSYLPELNKELAALSERLKKDGYNIVLVNQAEGWDWKTDTVADKVHPNASGAKKIADKWMAALLPLLEKNGSHNKGE